MKQIEVSLVIPCLNEQNTIGSCIEKAKKSFSSNDINGEIIVVDNGSTDNSINIAEGLEARVVFQPIRGYGAAYLKGIDEASGEFIVMGDGDDTYDFSSVPDLVKELKKGYDFVLGSRFKGKIKKGAMSFSHRYIGNPILTGMLNLFYKANLSDTHSGFRTIKRDSLINLGLQTTGMEFASEMIVSALRQGLKIKEIPIVYYPRKGESKLHSFSDAWRHMRFMLLFSPDWLFLIPGGVLFFGGFFSLLLSGWGNLRLWGHRFDIHAMIFFTFFSLLGYQIIHLGLFAKQYSLSQGFEKDRGPLSRFCDEFRLEKGIIWGILAFGLGLILGLYIVFKWVSQGFGPLNEVKLGLVGILFMFLGVQTVFSSFFLSLLNISNRNNP